MNKRKNLLLDLGTQPLVNNLCMSKDEALKIEQYPLRANFTEDLKISLDTEIPPHILYKNYYYHSGVSLPYIKHCEKMYSTFKHLKPKVFIDIGGNDGTLLKTFKKIREENGEDIENNYRNRYINVDASESFAISNRKEDIEYVNEFFSDKIDLPKADIITSTNVFQHTKDIDSFLRGIVKHLDGVWILEFPYTLTTLETLQFDQFYHEHYYYWLITPLEKLFKIYGLKIIHISEQKIHGGSLRIWSTNKTPSAPEVTDAITYYKRKEASLELKIFDSRVKDFIANTKNYLCNLTGKSVFFGAAAKGCVFLNALGITVESMPDSYVIDDTPEKQGFYLPGTGFEICSRNILEADNVENIIILSHNFKDYIANSLRNPIGGGKHFEGKIISLIPKIQLHE